MSDFTQDNPVEPTEHASWGAQRHDGAPDVSADAHAGPPARDEPDATHDLPSDEMVADPDSPTGDVAATQPATPPQGMWRTAPGVVWPTVTTPPLGTPTTDSTPQGAPVPARRGRQWLGIAAVAIVAALIGGVIGGFVGGKTDRPSGSLTILEGSSTPGSAILASGTSIPLLVKDVSPSVVSIDVTTPNSEDQGTGMIISKTGLVVTNNHVIAAAVGGSSTITVTRTGTTSVLPATLLGTDPTNDIALLQIQGAHNLPPVTFGNSTRLVVGDGVVAIGNALGLAAGTPTVTQGIVSALGRTVTAGSSASSSTETLYNMIQTDAAINPGNSGGPLIDSSGQVVGMNTAVAGATSDGSSAQNIGFAIPASRIERLLPTLLHGTTPTHRKGAYLGVYIRTVTPALAAANSLSVTAGALVQVVVPGLPAATAGIQSGDVIVSINGTTVASDTDVSNIMHTLKPGQTVPIGIVRGTQHVTVQVTVGTPPAA